MKNPFDLIVEPTLFKEGRPRLDEIVARLNENKKLVKKVIKQESQSEEIIQLKILIAKSKLIINEKSIGINNNRVNGHA